MLIDWFTVAAQTLNFLILVWLMKRFLYKPVLLAIDAREKRIAAELASADKRTTDAQKLGNDYKLKSDAFDRQRVSLLKQATDDAKSEGQKLLEAARSAADALSAARREALQNDAHRLMDDLRRRTQREVFAITRKALTDLSTTTLEERMSNVFIERLRTATGDVKRGLEEALKTNDPALVRSAFDLPAGPRAMIQEALNQTFSADIRVTFETAPELIGGIELSCHGQKVSWSIAEYLSSLQKSVLVALN